MTESETAAPTPPAAPKADLIEDFVDIFTSPGAVFARRANAGYGLVMLIVTVLIGVLFLVNKGTMQSIMDAEYARGIAEAMKKNPSLTEEQLASGKKFADFFTSFGVFVSVPIALFLVGFGAWLTSKILGASISFSAATTIATYSYLPKVLESVGVGVQGLLIDTNALTGRYQLTLGVGRFLDPQTSPGVLGLLGRVDVFTIWVSVLLGIGIGVVAKLPKNKAIAAGAIMWTFGALPALWALAKDAISG